MFFRLFSLLLLVFFLSVSLTGWSQEGGVSSVAGVLLSNTSDPSSSSLGMNQLTSSYMGSASLANPAQLAFSPYIYGGSLSYSPWLLGISGGDIFGMQLNGYYKLTDYHGPFVRVSFFNVGSIELFASDPSITPPISAPMYEWSATLGYAYALSNAFSIAAGVKYFESRLISAYTQTDAASSTATVFAGDLHLLYTKVDSGRGQIDVAFALSNLGTKAVYSNEERPYFIPSSASVGVSYSRFLQANTLRVMLNLNKDLVPYSPKDASNTEEVNQYYKQSVFEAWGQAIGEPTIGISVGLEYVYADMLFFRAGYFNDNFSYYKRDAFTLGLGYAFPFGLALNASYWIPGASYPASNRFVNTFSVGITYEY